MQTVSGTGQAFATSSTMLRRWVHDGADRHHIIDPRTGRPADQSWTQVSCAGSTAVEANAASTAAIILGADAPAWLQVRGIAARLDRSDGTTTYTPGWPVALRQRAA